MKLNIEELAREAGLHIITSPIDKGEHKLKLESFARLIVERCAVECDELLEVDTCPTCEALARTVMMDQTGAA